MSEPIPTCEWKEDSAGDSDWDTGCGRTFSFEYGPPREQGYKFCQVCGKVIKFTPCHGGSDE